MKKIALLASLIGFSHLSYASQQPNILWVLTDDQRMDSIPTFNRMLTGKSNSALGKVLSPNIDRLAKQGVTYINTFNQNPGCAPSRTLMHTGRYSHRSGVYDFSRYEPNAMPHWRKMVPQVLREAGYQTFTVGKQGLRYVDEFTSKKKKSGLYDVDVGYRREIAAVGKYDWNPHVRDKQKKRVVEFKFKNGDILTWPDYPEKDRKDMDEIQKRLDLFRSYLPGERPSHTSILGGVAPQPKDETRDGWYAREFEHYLSNANKEYTSYTGRKVAGPDTDKPVFAHVSFEAPHTPVLPPAEFRAQFQNIKYNVPEFNKTELDKFPPQLKKLYNKSRSDHYTDAEKQQMIADYYAFTAYADYVVGKSVDAFVKFSEKHNRPWMVLYVCGDHGWRLNEHGMISKFGPFDIDLRNPIIVVSSDKKSFPADKAVHDFTQFVDMAPTFYAAAGIDLKQKKYDFLDGQDLAKVAAGTHLKRDYIIAEPTHSIGPMAVIRTEDYKFSMKIRPKKLDGKNIKWAMNAKYKDIEPMFFDLRADPNEVNNLAHDPYYRPIIDILRNKIQDITLGDGRIEVQWNKKKPGGKYVTSNFAPGADDGKITLPKLSPKS